MLVTIDYKNLAYGVTSSLIFALFAALMKWLGFWRWAATQIRRSRGYRKYRRELREAVISAIVVGQRRHFHIPDIYVEMDLAPSDLGQQSQQSRARPPVMVLLGGPGAGKSTFVKHEALKRLDEGGAPFFLRLRDYSGEDPVEASFVTRLRQAGVPHPDREVEVALRAGPTLVILDGLDEVRVASREVVSGRIDAFYKKYFTNTATRSELIVTCRKEAYRPIPLDIPHIWEVRPLNNEQITRFAERWGLGYPRGKSAAAFCADLFAMPKVLQLARSPLLLVGGLMQYTESNLGIPEERFQYLARIARWLVSDWAAAQNLAPDPYRPLYDRILPCLAAEMHRRSIIEIPKEEAMRQFADWLPHYGGEPEQAGDVLEGICTKTGILVRDVPGVIVFAQLSLQEYYAASTIARSDALLPLVRDGVPDWWREAVLLAVAQIAEPGEVLAALFDIDATLAAEAVAECPTPDLQMQEAAVRACTEAIDRKHESAHRATVALLRKVGRGPEGRLLEALGKRLLRPDDTASTVGLILAHAGTERATSVIASHSDVWNSCLSAAGYLSSSFEQVLISVITGGNDANFTKAAELLVPRLSADRRKELLKILPNLTRDRAHILAGLLLRAVDAPQLGGDAIEVGEVATCAVHIHDLTMLPEREQNWLTPGIGEIASAVACENEIRAPSKLAVILERGLRWPSELRGTGAILASCIAAFSVMMDDHWGILAAVVASALAITMGFLPLGHRVPFVPSMFSQRRVWSFPAVVTGGTIVAMFMGVHPLDGNDSGDHFARAVAAIVFALPACAIAFDYFKAKRPVDAFGRWRFIVAVFLWTMACLAFAASARYATAATLPARELSSLTMLLVVVMIVSTRRHARVFEKATDVVERKHRDIYSV